MRCFMLGASIGLLLLMAGSLHADEYAGSNDGQQDFSAEQDQYQDDVAIDETQYTDADDESATVDDEVAMVDDEALFVDYRGPAPAAKRAPPAPRKALRHLHAAELLQRRPRRQPFAARCEAVTVVNVLPVMAAARPGSAAMLSAAAIVDSIVAVPEWVASAASDLPKRSCVISRLRSTIKVWLVVRRPRRLVVLIVVPLRRHPQFLAVIAGSLPRPGRPRRLVA